MTITGETTALDGTTVTTVYERGLARLVAHEVDHLDGCSTHPGCGRVSSPFLLRNTGKRAEPGHTTPDLPLEALGKNTCTTTIRTV
ncbi:hypothetical protein ACFC4G_41790 [Streptomyces sp. NPDC056002]|uniref:hypothetical protein n=1 Tax=Streptomyces sp. NPDC056002 TaxID=3345675 RepID=UPI0035DACC57